MDYILIHGGVGYLGYNIASYLTHNKYKVIIFSRLKSLASRDFIYNSLKKTVYKIVIYHSLDDLTTILDKYGCPKLTINLTGALYGPLTRLLDSNAYAPYNFFKKILEHKCDSLNIHISSFYFSQSHDSKYIYEEYPHLRGLKPYSFFEYSKALGEYLLKRLYSEYSGNIIILRPGFVIGRYPYHLENIIMFNLAMRRIELYDDRVYPYTPAYDIAKVAIYLMEHLSLDSIFKWMYLTPYNMSMRDFLSYISGSERILSLDIRCFKLFNDILPSKILSSLLNVFLRYNGGYYMPMELTKYGFRDWTPLDEVVHDMLRSIKDIPFRSVLNQLKFSITSLFS